MSWLVNSSLSPPAQIRLVSGSLNRKQSKIVNYRAPSYSLYVFTTVINRCDRPLCICSSACRECQQHSVDNKLMIIIAGKVFNTAKSLGRRFHFSIQTARWMFRRYGVVSGMFSILKMWRMYASCFCSKTRKPSTSVSFFVHASHSSSVYLSFVTTNIMDIVSLSFPFLSFFLLHTEVDEAPLGSIVFALLHFLILFSSA